MNDPGYYDMLPSVANKLLTRMSDPSTKTNYLRSMDLFLNPFHPFQLDPALKFPKMESLVFNLGIASPLPAFVFSCKNLRSFLCSTGVSSQELTLLLTELNQLKELRMRIKFEESMIEILKDPVQGRVAETLYFKDANSSLESLRIEFLPGDGIPNLVKACPDLKNLEFDSSDEINNMYFNFSPLRNLSLTSLDLWEMFDDMSEDDVTEIYSTLSSDSPLSKSLERFKVAQNSNKLLGLELLDSLTNCRQLRVLDIHACDEDQDEDEDGEEYDYHCIIYVASIFTEDNFPNLVELRLPCIEIDSYYANYILFDNDVFTLPLLKSLSICACSEQFDKDISRFAGRVLRSSPLLEKLCLRECVLHDKLFTLLAKDFPETCSAKFVVRGVFIDGEPTPTYLRDYSTYCPERTQHAEAMAARFGLNLKFLISKDDCIHYPFSTPCEFHE